MDAVSLNVYPGERIGLEGPSGAGKSMIGKAIACLLPRSATEVVAAKMWSSDNKNLNLDKASSEELRQYRRREIAMIWQDPYQALNPTQRIGDQLWEAIKASGMHEGSVRQELVNGALKKVQLDRHQERMLNSYPHQLSGGQQQRIVIAMALAASPRLLIADEPTTALDAETEKEIMQLLQTLISEKNLAMLLITHDRSLLDDHTDRRVRIEQGRLVNSGPPSLGAGNAFASGATSTDGPNRRLAVKVTDVSFSYVKNGFWPRQKSTSIPVLDDLNLQIYFGEWIALTGQSGTGKTTLARLLSRAIFPSSGSINIPAGRPGLVPQNAGQSLNPKHRVSTILSEAFRASAKFTSKPRPGPGALLGLVGLDAELIINRYPHQLSGGQRQRVAIARALATSAKFLIADESVSALDQELRNEILSLYQRLVKDHGLALLFITHDLSVAHGYADQTLELKQGKLSQLSKPPS